MSIKSGAIQNRFYISVAIIIIAAIITVISFYYYFLYPHYNSKGGLILPTGTSPDISNKKLEMSVRIVPSIVDESEAAASKSTINKYDNIGSSASNNDTTTIVMLRMFDANTNKTITHITYQVTIT